MRRVLRVQDLTVRYGDFTALDRLSFALRPGDWLMLVGPNHRRLLPASLFAGAIFLLLADLAARTLLSPIELSIGVVTSLVGAVAFVLIFARTRKGGA